MRRRTRTALRITLAMVLAWAAFAAWLFSTAWYRVPGLTPPPTGPSISLPLTRAEYESVIDTLARPYIYGVTSPTTDGAVVVFGAEHTRDPHDPQLERIRTEWDTLRPTILLVEGRMGILFPAFMDPVRTFGECGAAHALARRSHVPTRTWEPPTRAVVDALLAAGFSREQITLRFILNAYFSNLRFGRPADPDRFVLDTLAERAAVGGIPERFRSIADVDAAWRAEFPAGPDWRDVSDQFGLPGFLAEMDLNAPRDAHLISCIADLVARGERVMVVCGSSHAVVIEPAVRSLDHHD